MRFKEWCSSLYKINSFSEAKVLTHVCLPVIPENRPYPDALIKSHHGHITTYDKKKVLTFTQNEYISLEQTLRNQFHSPAEVYEARFTHYKTNYFRRLGFDVTRMFEYKTAPGIHIITDETEQFIRQFIQFGPAKSYDFLNKNESILMPATFLDHLYTNYYRSKEVNAVAKSGLSCIKKQKNRLEQLVDQVQRHNLDYSLNLSQKLALDYDNHHGTTHEACSAYAMSLKIYAELHRDGLTQKSFCSLYHVATLLAAHDRHGKLKQSLMTDALFVKYIKNDLYGSYLNSISHNGLKKGFPLISELTPTVSQSISTAIDENAEHLLHGHVKTRMDKNTYFTAQRFLPDANNQSDTDEIIFRGGGVNGHSANFRLIKVAVWSSRKVARAGDSPNHYEYFKIVNNLGIHTHQNDSSNETCLGTYVTKIWPCFRISGNIFTASKVNPFTHPKQYQTEMEDTLKELIKVERQLLFYQHKSVYKSACITKEIDEWTRLNHLSRLLSGKHHNGILEYNAQDSLNPLVKHQCLTEDQRGYVQSGGSCIIFSIKSLVTSIIGHELAALHTVFMQQHSAEQYIKALYNKISIYNYKIDKLSPLLITVPKNDVGRCITEFRTFLNSENDHLRGLTVLSTIDPGQMTIVLASPYLKYRWNMFMVQVENQQNHIRSTKFNPNGFFNQIALTDDVPPGFENHLNLSEAVSGETNIMQSG